MTSVEWRKLKNLAVILGSAAVVLLALTLTLVVLRHTSDDTSDASDSVDSQVEQWQGSAGNELWLVNEDHMLATTYEPADLVTLPDSNVQLASEAAEAFEAMCAKMDDPVVPANGYISAETQQGLYDSMLQQYLDEGYSEERAAFLLKGQYYSGGQDEHQLGLTVDVCEDASLNLNEDMLDTDQGKWLQENAWMYGFILRSQGETDAIYRPWQLRYVGRVHAQIMHEQGLSLESYLEMLEEKGVYNVTLENGVTYDLVLYCRDSLDSLSGKIKEVSGDNKGHYIITCYR